MLIRRTGRRLRRCSGRGAGRVIRADVRPSSVRACRCADAREATDVRADVYPPSPIQVARQRPRLTCVTRSALAWL